MIKHSSSSMRGATHCAASRQNHKMQKAAAGGLFFCLVPTCHPYNCTPYTALKTPAIGMRDRYPMAPAQNRVSGWPGIRGTRCVGQGRQAVYAKFSTNNPKKNYKSPLYCFTGISIFARIFLPTEETTEKGIRNDFT